MRRLVLIFCSVLSWILIAGDGATDPSDVSALTVLYTSMNSPPQLYGWSADQQQGDPCGNQWRGVTCSGSSVIELALDQLGLTGTLSYNLNNLKSLTILSLSSNNFRGQLPYQLPPKLQKLDLSGNTFDGSLPYSISDLSSLQYLDLSRNHFTGDLPQTFGALSSLNSLYLQNNLLTGSINVLADLPLENLNIENNRFTGWIPERISKRKDFKVGGNQWNTGPAPPPPPPSPPSERKEGSSSDGKGKSSLSGGAIAGIIIAVLVVGSIVAFFLIKSKSRRRKPEARNNEAFTQVISSDGSTDASPIRNDFNPAPVVPKQPYSPISIAIAPFNQTKPEEEHPNNCPNPNESNKSNITATMYSIADLQMATGSFNIDSLIGEGSIGRVYRAQFDDGTVLAVKKINALANSNQAYEGFMKVLSKISQLHHPNVTELVGFCCEHGQYLLAYEFHHNGSLHDFLHLSDEYSRPLTWKTRVKIALGSARALEYLHEVCSPSIVHNNFKSANILLDSELNPHLTDCGLSELTSDDCQAWDQFLGSGYSAPEVAMAGQYSIKSDVFSFGVVMLELLTGRKPFDSSRPRPEQSLVRWAQPQLHDIDALDKMVDPALKGLYPAKSLSRFADAIALCIQPEPEFRPLMSEVVQALVRLIQRANIIQQKGRDDNVDVNDTF